MNLRREKVMAIYKNLEKALLQEECTYEEAKMAVDKLRETYLNKKAGNYLKAASLQEIARVAPSSCNHMPREEQ